MRLPTRLTLLRGLGLLPILAVILMAAQFMPVPLNSIQWHGLQTLTVEIGVVFLITLLLVRRWSRTSVRNWFSYVQHPPLFCLSVLLIWGAFSCITASDRTFALQGLLQLFTGVFIVLFTALQVQTQDRLTFILNTMIATALLVALSSFASYGEGGAQVATGVLHDHMLFGAFLMLLLPICLAVSVSPLSLNNRLFAQAAFVSCLAALLVAQTRSAWIGEIISLIVFCLLAWSCRPAERPHSALWNGDLNRAKQSITPVVLVLVSILIFFWLLPDRDVLFVRAHTLTTTVAQGKDASTQWRLSAWSGAEKMIRERPLQGWGIGCYARSQFAFTQIGRTAEQVSSQGPTILDETHNSYLQLWAEIGVVGLVLWLAALGLFLAGGVRALKRYPARSPAQWALAGCLSAIVGQMADAFANPAWQFANIALPLWIVLGLTAALSRPAETVPKQGRHTVSTPTRLGQTALAAGVGTSLLWLIWRTAFALPAPHL